MLKPPNGWLIVGSLMLERVRIVIRLFHYKDWKFSKKSEAGGHRIVQVSVENSYVKMKPITVSKVWGTGSLMLVFVLFAPFTELFFQRSHRLQVLLILLSSMPHRQDPRNLFFSASLILNVKISAIISVSLQRAMNAFAMRVLVCTSVNPGQHSSFPKSCSETILPDNNE